MIVGWRIGEYVHDSRMEDWRVRSVYNPTQEDWRVRSVYKHDCRMEDWRVCDMIVGWVIGECVI